MPIDRTRMKSGTMITGSDTRKVENIARKMVSCPPC
jgi:hypothetical protein